MSILICRTSLLPTTVCTMCILYTHRYTYTHIHIYMHTYTHKHTLRTPRTTNTMIGDCNYDCTMQTALLSAHCSNKNKTLYHQGEALVSLGVNISGQFLWDSLKWILWCKVQTADASQHVYPEGFNKYMQNICKRLLQFESFLQESQPDLTWTTAIPKRERSCILLHIDLGFWLNQSSRPEQMILFWTAFQ